MVYHYLLSYVPSKKRSNGLILGSIGSRGPSTQRKKTCSTLLESILSFSFCFHKILWSSKCTSNMFILNFLDFLEVQVCLQEFFTDRKLFKNSFLDVCNDFAISCLQLSQRTADFYKTGYKKFQNLSMDMKLLFLWKILKI